MFVYDLEPDAEEFSPVRCLVHLPQLSRVAVGLSNGRLFLCRSDAIPDSMSLAEGTFVMTELGASSQVLFALAYRMPEIE